MATAIHPDDKRHTPCPFSLTLSDEELVRCCLAGQRAAFDELDRRYRQTAFTAACKVVGNEADAGDAVQQGFMKAFTSLHTLRKHSAFRSWLLAVVRRAALALGRQKSSRQANEAMIAAIRPIEETCEPLNKVLAKELQEQIVRFLQQQATPHQRLVCKLRIWEGLAYPEIAQRIEGQTERTVRHTMDELLRKLREYIR